MPPILTIRITGVDGDLAGIHVTASNGNFAGSAHTYISLAELNRLATHLRTFPASASDSVGVSGGEVGSSWGYLSAQFYCFDSSGHAAARITLQPKQATVHRKEQVDQLAIEIQFEAHQANVFSKALLAAALSGGGEATLVGERSVDICDVPDA